jgi:hypothetical protein
LELGAMKIYEAGENFMRSNLYSSENIIWMIKSRGKRRAGHLVHMGENINAYQILAGKHKGKRLLLFLA